MPSFPRADREQDWHRATRQKLDDLAGHVLLAPDPGTAAGAVLQHLRQELVYRFDLIYGPQRAPLIPLLWGADEAATFFCDHWQGKDPA